MSVGLNISLSSLFQSPVYVYYEDKQIILKIEISFTGMGTKPNWY